MIGQVFDRLKIIERAGTTPQGRALYRCKCSCKGKRVGGTGEKITTGQKLRRGTVRSCGCLGYETLAQKADARRAWDEQQMLPPAERKQNK